MLCSLHQVDLAREFADRIVGMRDGRVVFDGAPAEFTDERVQQLYAGAHWEDQPADADVGSSTLSSSPAIGRQPLAA